MGDAAVAAVAADGIDTTFITRDPATPSGVAFILVDDRGENSIAVAAGANDRLLPADVDRAGAAIRAADILLVQLEIPLETVCHAVALAHAAGVPVIAGDSQSGAGPAARSRPPGTGGHPHAQ
jgi:ribokinase